MHERGEKLSHVSTEKKNKTVGDVILFRGWALKKKKKNYFPQMKGTGLL